MIIVAAALSVSVAAFAVWLAVRTVNRKKKWAKRTAMVLIGVLLLYPLSIGPMNWIYWHVPLPDWYTDLTSILYEPYTWAISQSATATDLDKWWVSLWVDTGTPGANQVPM